MKTGISTACMHGQCETEKALEIISGTGVLCAEAALTTFYEYRPEFAGKFAERAGAVQVLSVSVSPFNFEHQLFSSSRRIRGDGFYWLEQVLRSAQLFGCKYFVLQGHDLGENKLSNADRAARICEISEFCARYGVSLCVRNSANGIFAKPSDFTGLKERCPALCCALDVAAAVNSGCGLPEYLRHISGAIPVIYLSDSLKGEYKKVLSSLAGAGFDGTILVDRWGGNMPELKGFLDEVGGLIK